jgi:hypothetical protein
LYVTDRKPEIRAARAAKSERVEEATAIPISGMVRVSVPPAALAAWARLEGSLFSLAIRMYDLADARALTGLARAVIRKINKIIVTRRFIFPP